MESRQSVAVRGASSIGARRVVLSPRVGRRPGAGRGPVSGLSLLELLITISLITIMVGAASYNYSNVIAEQNEGKARSECRQFVKALKTWENKKGIPISEYVDTSEGSQKFTLKMLEADRVMASIPDDPWTLPYEIDTRKGVVFSCGADKRPGTFDDIVIPFRAPFEALNARFDVGNRAVVVSFSRAVSRATITTETVKVTGGSPPAQITTLSVDMTNPYQVKAFLNRGYTSATFSVQVATTITSTDGTPLSSAATLSTAGSRSTT
ncbi:MAG: hypothetical protein HY815_19715 [Candidatus Riflebacteria bacterium]|nr:hypothetical protein [Candidatus Riflebacteria bacterium]